jgi:Glyoxalase-like domain
MEVIASDPDQHSPANPRPFGLDELTSPRLVGWALGCDDIDAAIANSRTPGYDPGDTIEMTRAAPNGTVLRWRLTLNAIGGGPVPFLISWGARHTPPSQPRKASCSTGSRSSTPTPTRSPACCTPRRRGRHQAGQRRRPRRPHPWSRRQEVLR